MSLFETGKDNLISDFKEHLAKHSQTMQAITVMDAIAAEEGELQCYGLAGHKEVKLT